MSNPEESSAKSSQDNGSKENFHDSKIDIADFQLKKVLNNNSLSKVVFLEGSFKQRPDPAVVIMEKKGFPDEVEKMFANGNSELEKQHHNDIYGNYECYPVKEFNGIKTTIIYPATEKHIEKFTPKPCCIVDETYELYKTATLPSIKSSNFSLKWVDNILDHTAEVDKIIYEDPDNETGFMMLPDLKWDGELQSLHVLFLSRKKLKSLRDLSGDDLPMLKKMKEKGSEVLQQKYNVLPSHLRMYIHYQPTFYHFHVHCTYLMQELNTGINTERAHMLTTVISNLEIDSDYYQKATLPFVVHKGDPIFKKYQELGILPSDEVVEASVAKKQKTALV